MTERYALMWSGGKDSALAVSRAQSLGLDVTKLLNFYDVTTGRVRFHATTVTMLQVQAEALGIELRAVGSTWAEMDVRFSQELTTLRSDGFDGVVFGDIFLEDLAVSRLHATIRQLPDGRYELEDHRSVSGTLVNGKAVTRCLLKEGDIVQIGKSKLTFKRA